MSRRPRGDMGVASVLMITMCLVLALFAAVLTGLASVAVARQRAASVADLAALAAASLAVDGPDAACSRATRLALDSDASVLTCELSGDVATVVAQVRPPGPIGRWGVASAIARAGPVPGGTGLDGTGVTDPLDDTGPVLLLSAPAAERSASTATP